MSCWHSETDECDVCRPKPTAAPEMPEGSRWKPCAAGFDDGRVLLVMCEKGLAIAVKRWVSAGTHMTEMSLAELSALLATQGLRIMDAKETAVLDASGRMPEKQLRDAIAEFEATPEDERTIHIAIAVEYCRAELARRGAKL